MEQVLKGSRSPNEKERREIESIGVRILDEENYGQSHEQDDNQEEDEKEFFFYGRRRTMTTMKMMKKRMMMIRRGPVVDLC